MGRIYFIVIMMFAIGCGTVDSNSPSEVNGEWEGLIYESDLFSSYLRVRIEEGDVIGSYKMAYVSDAHAPVRGRLVGNEDSFTMQVNIGSIQQDPWTYYGYVQDDNLCLSRDLLPSPVRCLSPVSKVNE